MVCGCVLRVVVRLRKGGDDGIDEAADGAAEQLKADDASGGDKHEDHRVLDDRLSLVRGSAA
jgi:hypothetical protein